MWLVDDTWSGEGLERIRKRAGQCLYVAETSVRGIKHAVNLKLFGNEDCGDFKKSLQYRVERMELEDAHVGLPHHLLDRVCQAPHPSR